MTFKRWLPTFLAFPLGAAAWTAVTAASWPLGWMATWPVIGDNADRGFYVFGASGALVVTLLTGLALRRTFAAPGETGSAIGAAAPASA